MGTMELNKKVTELKELEQYQKEIQAEIDEIKEDLKKELQARKKEELQVGLFTIRYKEYERSQFDTKGFKIAHKDLYDLYSKKSKSMRFTCQ